MSVYPIIGGDENIGHLVKVLSGNFTTARIVFFYYIIIMYAEIL